MLQKSNLPTVSNNSDEIMFVCGKRCYITVQKQCFVEIVTNDDRDGKEGGPSSISILVNWITDQVYCEKYLEARDATSGFNADDGMTKAVLCGHISNIIKSEVGTDKLPRNIQSKLDNLIG